MPPQSREPAGPVPEMKCAEARESLGASATQKQKSLLLLLLGGLLDGLLNGLLDGLLLGCHMHTSFAS
jgi:hypothetical protein